ncbi:MAG: ATP-binding protein [Aequorivita antarctica]
MEVIEKLAKTLQKEIDWFKSVVDTSLALYFKNESNQKSVYAIAPPDLDKDSSPYAEIVKELQLGFEERLMLILAMIPYLKPNVLDVFLIKNQNLNSGFSEFGGINNANKPGFTPTLETAYFILGGYNLTTRLKLLATTNTENILFKKGILEIDAQQQFGVHQKLQISSEYYGLFTMGKKHLPQYSTIFPANKITTALKWEDLVVAPAITEAILEIKDWLKHSPKILKEWNFENNFKKGYRALFYGPSGTGKTLTASLLGKETNRPVYRVDLSLVVSKYIGETEKNLSRFFDEAQQKDWILFFDEADALFGKRTNVRDAHDRYANQEVAYLLQRIEDFSGLVILSTNLKNNIDAAFTRRFQNMVHFSAPDSQQRKLLWEHLFKENFELESFIDLDDLAERYELTGGEITEVLRYCALQAARRNEKKVLLNDIITGIRSVYRKQNKTI